MFGPNFLIDSDALIDFLDYGVDFPHDFEGSNNSISVVTYYEVKYGSLKEGKADRFDQFLEDAGIEVLDITRSVIDKVLPIRIDLEIKGERLAHLDLLVGATALVHNLTLVTKNTKHYKRIPRLKLFL